MRIAKLLFPVLAGLVLGGLWAREANVWAVEPAAHPEAREWPFEPPFGTYDRASLQRGFLVFKEVCASCHGLEYLAFRSLEDIGFSEAEVKAIAAEYKVEDGPNDIGRMYEREAIPADYFPSPFANEKAARNAMGGTFPPDLSVITKARHDGIDYLYALLTGYVEPPEDFDYSSGLSYNPYFPNSRIAMPPPLYPGRVNYADGTEATVEQMAKDVTMFLAWVAEPKLEVRHKLGFKYFSVIIVLTVLLYFSNRKVWSGLKREDD